MECNKDEAMRAKGIAQKKMQNDDFEGARKIAQKAQQLFPELENINQLLTVCDVHCSARNKICGPQMDWYGILQVERSADEVTIKKQYRKLALVLHPDKNNFPGAESAFKLIGEANMVLSDQGKRSLYDSKWRVSMRTAATKPPPPHQFKQNTSDRKQCVPTQPTSSTGRQAFWTSCPFCFMRYQYYREFVNRALRCQNCGKPFIAYEIGVQSVTPGSDFVKPSFPQQKQAQMQGSFKFGTQSTGGFPPPQMGSRGSFSSKTVGSEPVSRAGTTAEVGGVSSTKAKEDERGEGGAKEGVESASVDAVKPREPGTSRNMSTKRRRKMVVESSESCDTATSVDTEEEVVIQENSSAQSSGINGVRHPRRSLRKKQHISYKENLDDDDNSVSPLKTSKGNVSSRDIKEDLKEENLNNGVFKPGNSTGFAAAVDREKGDIKQKGNVQLKGSCLNESGKAAENDVNGKGGMTDCNAKTSELIDDSESDSDSSCAPDPVYYDLPDPEFNDFDKNTEENCFAANQIWACYDTMDSMPRFYALIRKVFSPGFKLRITWLEPSPQNQDEDKWVRGELPFACGKFVRGNSEETTDRLSFSHQVHCEKGKRGSYMIYPRKGETWALFKDWDISWSSVPENHKKYQFQIVEVISDFAEHKGVGVACLHKVEGFVSVFQNSRYGVMPFLIPPTELLRFSHRIPSFKLIGTERDGIPKGSFELDPASVVTIFDECGDMKVDAESLNIKVNGSNPKSPGEVMKSMKSNENLSTPEKCVGFEGKNNLEKETFALRRSPRELESKNKKPNHMNASQCAIQEETAHDLHSAKDKKRDDLTLSEDSTPSRGDAKINLPVKDASHHSSEKIPSISQAFSFGGKILEEFHDFNGDKSEGKFQPGQIWALYNGGMLPKNYAQVQKIECNPFRLHVAMLEECTLSKDRWQSVCCGTFKPQTRTRVFLPSSFSHVLKPESIGKNRFKIFPRGGEIWALDKHWHAGTSCSDLKKGKYEIVKVIEDNEHCMKVSHLFRLNGFKSVFKTSRRRRSSSDVIEIPLVELARFSHQIPSFKLTDEKNGLLRDCWELDPASIPEFSS